MAAAKTKTSLAAVMLGDFRNERGAERRAEIKALFVSTSRYELADAAIERVQRNAVKAVTRSVE